jgi:hypothetical protein
MEMTFICRKCGSELPKSEFVPDKRRKNGIDLRCKECFNKSRNIIRSAIKYPPIQIGDKFCTSCKQEKCVNDFSYNPCQKDGRANWCKDCHRKDAQRRNNANPDYYKQVSYRKRIKLRYAVLSHYSGGVPICACCKETEIKFLCIDHMNGGGNAHRKTLPRGFYIYQWLKNQEYPTGFQVLCHNCNMAKGFYGSCPHQQ